MADEYAASELRVIAWQDWQASRARLRTQFSEPFDGNGPAPPGPPVEDPPAPPFVVIAWQEWRAPLARILRQYATGAFDESVGVGPPPPEPEGAPWQPPRVRRRVWIRNPYLLQSQPWDGDGAAPIAPTSPDFPPPNLTVIAWQDWRVLQARLRTQFTDAPQDLDGGVTQPTPDQSLVVIPWFAGRVPMEAIRQYIFSGEPTAVSGPTPDLFLNAPSYIYGRGYTPTRFSTRARVASAYSGTVQDLDGPAPQYRASYIPPFRPRRR